MDFWLPVRWAPDKLLRMDEVLEFIDPDELNRQQKEIFASVWENLVDYVRIQGKNPDRNVGYAESNVRPICRRIYQIHIHYWKKTGEYGSPLRTEQADEFVTALNEDKYLTNSGEPYSECSKRKFVNALVVFFNSRGKKWNPEIKFNRTTASKSSIDPLTIDERERILAAATEISNLPSYKNVSPEERDRYSRYLSQKLGKPKSDIGPEDWKRQSWKISSLISVSLDIGPRAALIKRLLWNMLNLEGGCVNIPGSVAVKNNQKWKSALTERSVRLLTKWREQCKTLDKYQDDDHIWLNRNGNPYCSRTLNSLFDKLLDEAGISESGRKLSWHSIRHSTGRYAYAQTEDLEAVAEILRHTSLESARRYAHPSIEMKRDVVESLQGGGI